MGKKLQTLRVVTIRRVGQGGAYRQGAIYEATPRAVDGQRTFRLIESFGPIKRGLKVVTAAAHAKALELRLPFSEVVRSGTDVQEWEEGGRP